MPSGDSPTTTANSPHKLLGLLWIIYGIIRLAMSFVLVAVTPTATVMFGALLTRVANPFALMSEFHIAYTCAIILSVLCGIFGVIAGLALQGSSRTARTLALIAAVLSLSEIPLGLTLGTYTLVVLLPE